MIDFRRKKFLRMLEGVAFPRKSESPSRFFKLFSFFKQQAPTTPPEKIHQMLEAMPHSAQYTATPPVTEIAPPSVKDVAIHPGKRDLSRYSLAKNVRTTAQRKLSVSMDTKPGDTTSSSAGTQRSKTQKQCAILEIKEGANQSGKSSIPDANPDVADAASDAEDAVLRQLCVQMQAFILQM
ncbi:hypothetical protein BS78_03G186400 [Paspalum vaginatum]|nr:hypothetical protein BS78_03G186400 [Paspalum vaginatum]